MVEIKIFKALSISKICIRLAVRIFTAVIVAGQYMGCVHASPSTEFTFVALGDMPYGPDESAGVKYRDLIQGINKTEIDFSIHVGDIKSGSSPCSDEEFLRQRRHFDMYEKAVIYTPGDNEWTDCHRRSNGAYDPLERLAQLRKIFFSSTHSMGRKPIPLESQAQLYPEYSRYVENLRWKNAGVLFVTLHIVGSNNNFEVRDPNAIIEFFARDRANIAWINSAFDLAEREKLKALIFAFQGNPSEVASRFSLFPTYSGFRNSIAETLLPRAQRFNGPILLVNGDTHEFRFEQPFTSRGEKISNLYQLVVPGDQDSRAIRVTVRPESAIPFLTSFIVNSANMQVESLKQR